MELLVKRDPVDLIKTEGNAVVNADIPDYLKIPRVARGEQIEFISPRSSEDDLLIASSEDYEGMMRHLKYDYKPHLNSIGALWSGYRSAILQDSDTKKWYKIKGIAFDPKKPVVKTFDDNNYRIVGAMTKMNAEYEAEMSEKFNDSLRGEGIEPVMEFKGMWEYPVKAKGKTLAASVMEIKGDTRLDELMAVLDGLASKKYAIAGRTEKTGKIVSYSIGYLTNSGEIFQNNLKRLYHEMGFVTGRLKKIMDKNNQTWSSDCTQQSNSHIGNIVVYNGTECLKVGLVDFDISCDSKDFSKSKLKALQKKEIEDIKASVMGGPISPREINGLPFSGENFYQKEIREKFAVGFDEGYSSRDFSIPYKNTISLEILHDLFKSLIKPSSFSSSKPRTQNYEIEIFNYPDFFDKKIAKKGLEDVLLG